MPLILLSLIPIIIFQINHFENQYYKDLCLGVTISSLKDLAKLLARISTQIRPKVKSTLTTTGRLVFCHVTLENSEPAYHFLRIMTLTTGIWHYEKCLKNVTWYFTSREHCAKSIINGNHFYKFNTPFGRCPFRSFFFFFLILIFYF